MTIDSKGTPLTTLLFLPGSNARALEKSKTLDVDAIIIDLEDAVSPKDKALARDQATQAARSHAEQSAFGAKKLFIRVNAHGTPFMADDLAMLQSITPDGVILPKVECARDIASLADMLGGQSLYAMIETPKGVLGAAEIAEATPALKGLIAGTNDLAAELGATVSADRAELMTSLQLILLAARSAGLAAYDGVYNAIKDTEGLISETEQGKALGFDGKCLIHPSQIEPVKGAYAPTTAEIAEAEGMIAAFKAAEKGVATYQGRMIEELHLRRARQIISRK